MDRREALRRLALIAGGTASLSTLPAVVSGCHGGDGEGWEPEVLTAHQNDLVISMSDHIIPRTETAGARDVYVNRFIDTLLGESFLPEERETFLKGLDGTEERCKQEQGLGFLDCSFEQQRDFLSSLDDLAFDNSGDNEGQVPSFFRRFKELTLIGYYTSEVGASEELKINIIPGRYDGCVPYKEVGRAWSQEV